MNGVFSKTAKGLEVIDKRTEDMSLRVRRILIMVDGKRTVDELRELALSDDLDQVLEQLEKDGFIETNKPVSPPVADAEGKISFTFRELPATLNQEDMEKARHFIINTLNTFCGPQAHLSIIKAASAATTHQELRESFLPWYEAIIDTASGRRRAEELSGLLLKII